MRRLRRWKVDNLSLFLIVDVYYSQLEAHIKRVRTLQKLVHNPSLSAEIGKQWKLFPNFLFIAAGSSLTGRWKKKIETSTVGGCWFLAKESQKGMGEQSEANPYPNNKKTKIRYKHRQVVADFLQRSPKQGWANKAKTIIDKKDIIHQAPQQITSF